MNIKKQIIKLMMIILMIPSNLKALNINATSSILMDQDSKRILYANNINNVRNIASISKIMTAILVIENINIKTKITVGSEIEKSYGSGIYIKQNEQLTIEDLLFGLMLRSGNDASYTLAVAVSKTVENFVKLMNDKALELGMKDTIFTNPNGLEDTGGNKSTSYDMAILASYANDNPIYRKIVSTKKYILQTNMNTYIWYNKNKLLNMYEYTTGGKTGYTEIAKRTLVTTATKNDLNLVVVTLNDGDDFNDHIELFEYGFSNYYNKKILRKGTIKINNNDDFNNYTLYLKNDLVYPITKEEEKNINFKFNLKKENQIINNQEIGSIDVYLGDKIIHKENIYIKKEQIKQSSFIQKIIDWIKSI
ncbi:MAG: D-alanyl-D-alanine carboxypeptidase family protein [Bacilli bacterium]